MARLLALEWDDREARYAVANTRGTRVVIEATGSLAAPEDAADRSPRAWIGAALAEEPAIRKAGRTLLAVDRSQIELLELTLPPSSDVELPELVRNQAARESSAVTEDTALDFVTLTDDPSQSRKVAAAALSRDRLKQIRATCDEASISPDVILLRPYATAALFAALPEKSADACLLVNVYEHEVDLIVMQGERVILWRTLRQSNTSTDAASAKRLVADIQRTLLVAAGVLGGEAIGSAFVFGGPDEHPALLEQLQADTTLNVAVLDPFDSVELSGERPERAGRFSAVLGMLTIEARRQQPAIDFLHPRRTPPPPDRRRMAVLAGSAIGLLLLLGGYQVWSTMAEVDDENTRLTEELDRLDDSLKLANKRHKVVQAIQDWGENDVNWLDELRDLSLRLPSGRDLVLVRMGMSHARNLGGTIDVAGVVRDPAIVSRIENSVRDKDHQISSRHVQERDQDKGYTWHFEAQLVVSPRDAKNYAENLPALGGAVDAQSGQLPVTSTNQR